jgi:predicted dienelactone hydrolase
MVDWFSRGAHPVGVRTARLEDAPGGGRLDMEVWYPAAEAHRDQDLDPAAGDRFEVWPGFPVVTQQAVRDAAPADVPMPLLVFSHGATSHRRASTHLCCHLASHGYAVASVDHPGSTVMDMMSDLTGETEGPPRLDMTVSARHRPREVSTTVDRLLAGAVPDLAGALEPDRIGALGVSFGGWTTLAVNGQDVRFKASFPIVPAFGKGPLGTNFLEDLLDLASWGRDVPTLVLAAEQDALIMLDELRRLHRELRCDKRLVILNDAGHVHFVDGAEQRHEMLRMQFKSGAMPKSDGVDFVALGESMKPFSEHCPAEVGALVVRGLGLAHMEAWLRGSAEARAFLGGDLEAAFAARGADVEVV